MKKNIFLWLFCAIYLIATVFLLVFYGKTNKTAVSFVLTNLLGVGVVLFILFYGKKKSITDSKVVISLPSIIFNNTKSINIGSIFLLCVLLMLLYFSKFIDSLLLSTVSIILFIVFAFLMAPKKLVLTQFELIYDKYWKEKLENIAEYKISNGVLIIKTKNHLLRNIKKINEADLVIIETKLKEKQIKKTVDL